MTDRPVVTIDRYIELYGRRLFGLCLKLCASRADAEDLYQDTWLKCYRSLDRYDPDRPFEPWAARICVRTYADRLRRAKVSRLFDGFSTTADKDLALERASVPDDTRDRELRDAVDRLPEPLRTSIILYYFSDMALPRAAAAMGVPEGTMKSRLHRARQLLKEALSDESLLKL